jgi:hypothetical protein
MWIVAPGQLGPDQATFQGEPVFLVDASDLANPTPFNNEFGYFFYGHTAPQTVTGLSGDWLTEVIAGPDYTSACEALGQAASRIFDGGPANPDRFQLDLAYSCTEGGKRARIVRKGMAGSNTRLSYIVVDAEDRMAGGDRLIVAKEIWFSTAGQLLPDDLIGQTLKRPGHESEPIDVDRIKERIARSHP